MADDMYKNLVSRMLELVPELQGGYSEMANWYAGIELTGQDFQDLEGIRALHGLEETDPKVPGVTIVFEELLVPHIVSLLKQRGVHITNKLRAIMDWMEELARSGDDRVRSAVAICVCQPFLTNYADKFEQLHPYLGNRTKELCRAQLMDFKVGSEIRHLLD